MGLALADTCRHNCNTITTTITIFAFKMEEKCIFLISKVALHYTTHKEARHQRQKLELIRDLQTQIKLVSRGEIFDLSLIVVIFSWVVLYLISDTAHCADICSQSTSKQVNILFQILISFFIQLSYLHDLLI